MRDGNGNPAIAGKIQFIAIFLFAIADCRGQPDRVTAGSNTKTVVENADTPQKPELNPSSILLFRNCLNFM